MPSQHVPLQHHGPETKVELSEIISQFSTSRDPVRSAYGKLNSNFASGFWRETTFEKLAALLEAIGEILDYREMKALTLLFT